MGSYKFPPPSVVYLVDCPPGIRRTNDMSPPMVFVKWNWQVFSSFLLPFNYFSQLVDFSWFGRQHKEAYGWGLSKFMIVEKEVRHFHVDGTLLCTSGQRNTPALAVVSRKMRKGRECVRLTLTSQMSGTCSSRHTGWPGQGNDEILFEYWIGSVGQVKNIVEITEWHDIRVQEENPPILHQFEDHHFLHNDLMKVFHCWFWQVSDFDT